MRAISMMAVTGTSVRRGRLRRNHRKVDQVLKKGSDIEGIVLHAPTIEEHGRLRDFSPPGHDLTATATWNPVRGLMKTVIRG